MAGCSSPEAQAIDGLFRLLSRAHMIGLLHHLVHEADGPVRFVDLQDALGASPNTLTARLRELAEAGFVTRTAYNEIPPRVEYAPTQRALALCPVFDALHGWARDHTGSVVIPA